MNSCLRGRLWPLPSLSVFLFFPSLTSLGSALCLHSCKVGLHRTVSTWLSHVLPAAWTLRELRLSPSGLSPGQTGHENEGCSHGPSLNASSAHLGCRHRSAVYFSLLYRRPAPKLSLEMTPTHRGGPGIHTCLFTLYLGYGGQTWG